MSCGCGGECCKQSDRLLSGLSGLLGEVQLGSYPAGQSLRAGVTFSQGYHLNAVAGGGSEAYSRNEIEGCLYATGAFLEIRVAEPSGYFNRYWQIDGRTAVEFGRPQDLQDLIRGTLQTCVFSETIDAEFPLTINTFPAVDSTGNQVDQSTGPNPQTTPNAQTQCQSGQIYRGWLYGCQPVTCPPGQVYKEDLLSAGCKPVGEKGLFEKLGIKSPNTTGVLILAGVIGAVVLLRK